MVRFFGILVMGSMVWSAGQVYTHGAADAFGGAYSLGSADPLREQVERSSAAMRRAAGAYQRAWDVSEARVDRMLDRFTE